MTQFHTDQPITGSADSPDRLGREKFAALVGESLLLKADSPGIVVSLEGPWGYGKTSAINLIQRYFQSLLPERQPIVVGFNPWMVSGTANLTQEFLVQLAAEIGAPDGSEQTRDAARQLLSYSKIFTVLKYVPGAEPWATIVENVIKGAGEASDAIGKLKELSVGDKRDQVVKAILALDRPIVVFIDDIDRLPPDEVFHMIRMVKAVADFPRIAFVLALDPDYVSQALEKGAVANPSLYLDKIIQVRLPLPIIERSAIEVMVYEELDKLAQEALKEHFPNSAARLIDLYHSSIKYLLHSPQDVRKLFNNIIMREPHIRGEVIFADIFALETLAMKAPEIYRHIRNEPAAYTGVEPGARTGEELFEEVWAEGTHSKAEKHKEERDRFLGRLPETNRRHIERLLKSLFPQFAADGQKTAQIHYTKNGRVAALDRLMIALKFGLPISEVSYNTVRRFLSGKDGREEMLKEIGTPETLGRFLELLTTAVEQLNVTEPEHFVEVLTHLAEQPLVGEMDRARKRVLDRALYDQIWDLLEVFLEKLDYKRRLSFLRALATDYRKVGVGARALRHCLIQAEGTPRTESRWCNQEDLNDIKSLWIATVAENATRDAVFSLNGASAVFFLLHRLDVQVCAKVATSLLENDADVDTLVLTIGQSGRDSTNGRFAHVTGEFLDSIGGQDKIRARVQQRMETNTEASTELRAKYMSVTTGNKHYLADCSEGEPF